MQKLVNKKPLFWIALVALGGLISAGTTPVEAGAKRSRSGSAKSIRPIRSASARPLYSPERSLSRKAKLTRARAIAMVPDVRAAAAIIYDPETNQVLWEENSQSQRSIASITKMMTAVVFMEGNPDLMEPVTIERSDVYQASTTHLRANDHVTTGDLLHLLLIASDNAAARALARVSLLGFEAFIQRMNAKAAELGLETTHYADPSGLLSENVSSAFDLARLITHVSGDDRIASIMRTPEYTVYSGRRAITFRSTNHLLGRTDVDVRAGKTGFISKSGYCLATLLRLPQSNQEVAVVVLGAHSNAGRFMETQNLFRWMSSKASALFATRTPALPAQ
jgi:D-alanyl-D-alanine endopeptidase (penicillin-binding protein 7)